ncbi:hypothetical protein RDWZM_000856 [Blomia tropicalis]|uniref:Secreted protein n=1 Tax=Blomia tropicalis TaxID=40697 RepID=A0A9Q0RQV0_BLOTA|nr:hypothetical protein RDWZM_000856 [Blomia tropicalis]
MMMMLMVLVVLVPIGSRCNCTKHVMCMCQYYFSLTTDVFHDARESLTKQLAHCSNSRLLGTTSATATFERRNETGQRQTNEGKATTFWRFIHLALLESHEFKDITIHQIEETDYENKNENERVQEPSNKKK